MKGIAFLILSVITILNGAVCFGQQLKLDKLGTVAIPKRMTEISKGEVDSFAKAKFEGKIQLDFMVNKASKVYLVEDILVTIGYTQLTPAMDRPDYLLAMKKAQDGSHYDNPSYSSKTTIVNGNKFVIFSRDALNGRCIIINGLNESNRVRFDCSLQYPTKDEAKAQALATDLLAGVSYRIQ